MKRTIFNKLMMTMLIILIYFNYQSHAMEITSIEYQRLPTGQSDELVPMDPVADLLKSIIVTYQAQDIYDQGFVKIDLEDQELLVKTALAFATNFYSNGSTRLAANDNNAMILNEQYANAFWTQEKITERIKNFFGFYEQTTDKSIFAEIEGNIQDVKNELKTRKSYLSCPSIIKLFPVIFHINVTVFDPTALNIGERVKKYESQLNLPGKWHFTNPLGTTYIIKEFDRYFPTRSILDLKDELEIISNDVASQDNKYDMINIDIPQLYNTPRAFQFEPTLRLTFENVFTTYNINEDYREKRIKYRDYLYHTIVGLNDVSVKNELDAFHISHGVAKQLEELWTPEKIYSMKKCFDLYIPKDNQLLTPEIFETILASCKIYEKDLTNYVKQPRITREDVRPVANVLSFYYWYKFKMDVTQDQINVQLNQLKKNVAGSAFISFIGAVNPICSLWKLSYMQKHPGEAIYNINIDMKAMSLGSFWGLYPLFYLDLNNPLLMNGIAKDLDYQLDELNGRNAPGFFGNCRNSLATCIDNTCNDFWKKIITIEPIRKGFMEAEHFFTHALDGWDTKKLVTLYLGFTFLTYMSLEAIVDAYGLKNIVSTDFAWYEWFVHAPFELVEIFILSIGGRSDNFNIPDATGSNSNFMLASNLFMFEKLPILAMLAVGAIQAKLFKLMVVNTAKAFYRQRHCIPQKIGNVFIKLFHIKDDDNTASWCQWLSKKQNWIPVVSRFGAAMVLWTFAHKILPEHFEQKDASDLTAVAGLLWIWAFMRYLPNALHHQLNSRFSTMDVVERERVNKMTGLKGTLLRRARDISQYRIQIFFFLFLMFLFLFYEFATYGMTPGEGLDVFWRYNVELLFVTPLYSYFWTVILAFLWLSGGKILNYFSNAHHPVSLPIYKD